MTEHKTPPTAEQVELRDALAFFDKVRAATTDELIAVGTDHWDRLEAAARALAALAPAERAEAVPDGYERGVLAAVAQIDDFLAGCPTDDAGTIIRNCRRLVIALLPENPTRAGALDAAGAETHTVDYLRLRFFRDLTDGQRLTIFDRAGLGKEAEEAGSTHAWQRLLFNRMIREGQERLIVEALKAALAAGDGRSEK